MFRDLTNNNFSPASQYDTEYQQPLMPRPASESYVAYMPQDAQQYQPQQQQQQNVFTPIHPEVAAAELSAIRDRLIQITQGMAAWMASGGVCMQHKMADAMEKLNATQSHCATVDALQRMVAGTTPPSSSTSTEMYVAPLVSDTPSPLSSHNLNTIAQPPKQSQAKKKVTLPTPSAPCDDDAMITDISSRKGCNLRRVSTWPPHYECRIILVEFKRQRMRRFVSDVDVKPGQYVIVPGDRGYDCGLVVQCAVWSPVLRDFVEGTVKTMDTEAVDIFSMNDEVCCMIREATEAEIEQLYGEQASKERLALKACRDLVLRLNLQMNVVDCEYQFDGSKISFFFEASRSIDFRPLNKELYRIFSARIWLENVNNTVRNIVPEGAISRNDKAAYRRNGLKAPATY